MENREKHNVVQACERVNATRHNKSKYVMFSKM